MFCELVMPSNTLKLVEISVKMRDELCLVHP